MAFSNNIKVTGFQITSTEPMYTNRAWSGSLITRSTNIQYYNLQFTLNFSQENAPEVQKFIAQYSQGKPFQMDLGYLSQYKGVQTAAISASAVEAAGTYKISTTQNSLEVGSLIQFSNHAKIYRVIANTGTTISIFPNLRSQVNTGEPVKFNNLQGSFILDPTNNNYQMQVQKVMSVQLNAVEYI